MLSRVTQVSIQTCLIQFARMAQYKILYDLRAAGSSSNPWDASSRMMAAESTNQLKTSSFHFTAHTAKIDIIISPDTIPYHSCKALKQHSSLLFSAPGFTLPNIRKLVLSFLASWSVSICKDEDDTDLFAVYRNGCRPCHAQSTSKCFFYFPPHDVRWMENCR